MRERGAIFKQRGKNLHTAVLFPADYKLAMSSLAFHSIYSYLNNIDGVLCDRFVADVPRSIEHKLEIDDFKVVFVTVPFILDAPAVLNICHRYRSSDQPTVFCIGGISAAANPALYSICDNVIVFTGDFESHTRNIITILNLIKAGAQGKEIIIELSDPARKKDITLQELSHLEFDPPTSVIYTKDTEFSNMHLVEINRGCKGNCHFCMSKHILKQYREFGFEGIIRGIDRAPPEIRTIGLVGDAVLSHSRIQEIVDYILKKGKRPSFASVRITDIRVKKIDLLLKSDIKTLTIAPEVASRKLMKITNKYYDRLLLFETLKELVKGGVVNIKLYMIIGLPGETREDIEEMISLVKDIRNILINSSKERGRLGTLRVSINNFVPSPFTPLFNQNPDSIENLKNKQEMLKRDLSDLSNLSLSLMDIFETLYQTALFRADASLSREIINCASASPIKRFRNDDKFKKEILDLCYRG